MLSDALAIVKSAVKGFANDEALTRAAALAFYSALSFAPLLVLLVWLASIAGQDAQQHVLAQLGDLMGPEAKEAAAAVLANAEREPSVGSLSAIGGLAVLLFSATGVFAQLQKTLNRIWNVDPEEDKGIRNFVRARLISAGMLGALGFLLMVSLVLSTVVNFAFASWGPLVTVSSYVASVLLFSVAFAAIYRLVPDRVVRGRDALLGGFMTALLFSIGKEGIGIYLGRGSVGTAYGAAGSLVVLLVWAYYSGIVVLFGAELTQAYARQVGGGLGPAGGPDQDQDQDQDTQGALEVHAATL